MARTRDESSEEYRKYLQSPEWKATRKEALRRAGHRCQICNSSRRLDVHHRTYANLGHEEPEDLTVLCRGCHDRHHDALGKRGRTRRRVMIPEGLGPERQLLVVLLHDRNLVERAAEKVGPSDFRYDAYRELFEALLADPSLTSDEGLSPAAAARLRELSQAASELMHKESVYEASVAVLADRAGRGDKRGSWNIIRGGNRVADG